MRLKVRSIGLIRQVLGAAELDVDVPEGACIPDLLTRLVELKGEKFAPFAVVPKQPTAYAPLRVVVNGRDVGPAQQRAHILVEGDDVLMFLPIAGG
jgi:molybdopterin converting factor small subunit